ncbi:MAG: hypothetical protein WC343_13265 [Bacilli bacterium]|jgi:hypothetical protein
MHKVYRKSIYTLPMKNVYMARARDVPEQSWDNVVISQSGKQARIVFYVDIAMIPRMRAISEILSKTDAWRPKGGRRKNTPGMYAEYCTRTVLESAEKLIEKNNEELGETDAGSQAAHNDG